MDHLDAARKDTIRLLCQAQAEERLSVDTFESRLAQVRQAPNQATLAAIVADLDYPDTTAVTRYHSAGVPDLGGGVAPAEVLRIASVLGSTTRAGSWTVPHVLEARVLFGEMTIDLRDAVFGADVVDIDIDVKFGEFKLIVPAGTQVENELQETLSSSTHSTRGARGVGANGLLVRITGSVLLGSVSIKEKFPTADTPKRPGILARLFGGGEA